jgi:hypothetical protein
MSAELITVWAIGLIFGVPLTLIFWAHIYLALKDIFEAHAIATEARRAETSSGSVHEGAGAKHIAQTSSSRDSNGDSNPLEANQ